MSQPSRRAAAPACHTHLRRRGPWIEQYWIDEFANNRGIFDQNNTAASDWIQSRFGGAIPIFAQWTDCAAHGAHGFGGRQCNRDDGKRASCAQEEELRLLFRPTVAYVTVAQHDCGILGTWCKAEDEQVPAPLARLVRNIFVFSAGGYGHVPIPLIRSSMAVEAPEAPKDRRYWVSFAGTVGHAPRMFRENLSKCGNRTNYQGSPAGVWNLLLGLRPPIGALLGTHSVPSLSFNAHVPKTWPLTCTRCPAIHTTF